MVQLYMLFEHACGYSLFQVKEFEEVGSFVPQVQSSTIDASKFKQFVKVIAYRPFASGAIALQNINAVCEGTLTQELEAFLEANLPDACKNGNATLGVCDPKLAGAIAEALSVKVTHVGAVPEILRGIRFHLSSLIQNLSPVYIKQAELGLGHSFSRGKVKFNVNRVDNMIIQSIALCDQMDKDVNLFSMRMREWYSYHFPELARVVTDNHQYARCACVIGDRTKLTKDKFDELDEITMDSTVTQAIFDASRMSMGMDIDPNDLANIESFAKRVDSLSQFKKRQSGYLRAKMDAIAPNLSAVIGEVVGARLIAHAGSLTNLAKAPASTVQILGAEKALFRALKLKSNTPKYGLIYHSSFIGKAGLKNKGRISRFLANKCSIATRIDCFSENLNSVFGDKLRGQVEERLKFYETGDVPRKNQEVMTEALQQYRDVVKSNEVILNKRKASDMDESGLDASTLGPSNGTDVSEPKKKKKKKNKDKKAENGIEAAPVTESPADDSLLEHSSKKKKKKKDKKQEA